MLSCVWIFATPWTIAHHRLLWLWNFPGKNTGVGYHFLLQRIFQAQGSNLYLLCLLQWQGSHLGSLNDKHHWIPKLIWISHTRSNQGEVKWKSLSCVQVFVTPWSTDPGNSPGQNTGVENTPAFPFSRGSSQPKDQTQISCIAGRFFTSWATREVTNQIF